MSTKKPKSKKRILEPLISFDENQQTDDPDRLSYIYRFVAAVWLTANSTSTRVNAAANDIFEDVLIDLEDEEEDCDQHHCGDARVQHDCRTAAQYKRTEREVWFYHYGKRRADRPDYDCCEQDTN